MQSESERNQWSRREFLGLGLVGVTLLACPSHFSPGGKRRVIYSPEQSNKNLIVNIGDSIARGGVTPNPVSPADLVANEVNTHPERRWEVLNLAQVGVTTREVIKHQLLDPILIERLNKNGVTDVDLVIHTGANDIGKHFAGDEKKIRQLKKQLSTLDASILRTAFTELWDAVAKFGEDLNDLLELTHIIFGKKIRHLIVISPPDFSQAPKINSYIEGKVHSFPLDNPMVQFLVREGCRELREQTDETVRGFSIFNSLTIPTDEINRSHFIGDQHLNRQGNLIISRNFLSRVVLT